MPIDRDCTAVKVTEPGYKNSYSSTGYGSYDSYASAYGSGYYGQYCSGSYCGG